MWPERSLEEIDASPPVLSPVEMAACKALAAIRELPAGLQSDAFVLMVKMVIEGGAVPVSAHSTGTGPGAPCDGPEAMRPLTQSA